MRLALSLLLSAPLAALAQILPQDYTLLGVAVRTRPAYDGSASQATDLIPVIRYYGSPWFARTTQGVLEGGVRTEVARGLNLGAQVVYEEGRKAGESGLLSGRGFPNISPGASVGVHAEWDFSLGKVPFTLLARYRQNADADRGAKTDLRLNAGVFESGSAVAAVYAQATWADAKSNRFFYGITAEQSATSGLPAYSPGGGLLSTTLGLLWSADLTRSWVLVGGLSWEHLQDGAANSPLAERASNYYANIGVAYRF
jgi:MipA family protein